MQLSSSSFLTKRWQQKESKRKAEETRTPNMTYEWGLEGYDILDILPHGMYFPNWATAWGGRKSSLSVLRTIRKIWSDVTPRKNDWLGVQKTIKSMRWDTWIPTRSKCSSWRGDRDKMYAELVWNTLVMRNSKWKYLQHFEEFRLSPQG